MRRRLGTELLSIQRAYNAKCDQRESHLVLSSCIFFRHANKICRCVPYRQGKCASGWAPERLTLVKLAISADQRTSHLALSLCIFFRHANEICRCEPYRQGRREGGWAPNYFQSKAVGHRITFNPKGAQRKMRPTGVPSSVVLVHLFSTCQ